MPSESGRIRIHSNYIETRIINDSIVERKCTECNEFKLLSEFYKSIKCYLGTISKCKKCLIGKEKLNKLKKFELTVNAYNELIAKGCIICESTEDLVLDHCHITTNFRGILCRNCNSGLGNFKDNIKLLIKAIQYLEDKTIEVIIK